MIELPSAQQEAEKRYPARGEEVEYGPSWRTAYAACYTELYLPERQRAEAQGKLIEQLVEAGNRMREEIQCHNDQAANRPHINCCDACWSMTDWDAALSSVPASTTKEQEPDEKGITMVVLDIQGSKIFTVCVENGKTKWVPRIDGVEKGTVLRNVKFAKP